MTDMVGIFTELGLTQYLDVFSEQGFESWDTILDITESDFDALGVKLGHRRKLQRRIANFRGISSDRALASPKGTTPTDDRHADDGKSSESKPDAAEGIGGTHTGKRKYRRHPKPDEHAPERPPSAYVIFSNKMREDLKGRHLSFTEIAKLVGENWQNLSPSEKEPFETQALLAKEKYNSELAIYKKTDNHKNYAEYLLEFKIKQSSSQQGASESNGEATKRPKFANQISTDDDVASSTNSQQGTENYTGGMREQSVSSVTTPAWFGSGSNPSPSQGTSVTVTYVQGKGQGSPIATSPRVLPGYRESIVPQVTTQHTLAWREVTRDHESSMTMQQLPRVTNTAERRSSKSGTYGHPDSPNQYSIAQDTRRTSVGYGPPPLLSTESTSSTTKSSVSSASTASSLFYAPRTPLEPSLDRSLPIPLLFPIKPIGSYDNQLPPIRPPSLSPQSSSNPPFGSPSGSLAVDFGSRKGYTPTTQASPVQLGPLPSILQTINPSSASTAEPPMDPVSALIRAGEIVNRNSQRESQGWTPPKY